MGQGSPPEDPAMEMSEAKVCPVMSIRRDGIACIEDDCALYLSGPRRCSLLFLGYKAMLDIQQRQQEPSKTL